MTPALTSAIVNVLIGLNFVMDMSLAIHILFLRILLFFWASRSNLEPENGLNYGNFVKNGGSRSKKCDLSAINQLGMWS